MGLHQIYDIYQEFWQSFQDIYDFERGGILSKEISLEYNIVSDQPHLNFNCKKDKEFSFRVHDLELGTTPEEAYFWHSVAQRGEAAKFNGFINMGYPLIKGSLRGILSVDKEFHRLGVLIRDGRIIKKRNNEEMNKSVCVFIGAIAAHLDSLEKVQNIPK